LLACLLLLLYTLRALDALGRVLTGVWRVGVLLDAFSEMVFQPEG
jgi:hypothetical protein